MASPTPAAPTDDALERAADAMRPGGVEDRYRSLFLIGRGGMGTVEVALERGAEGFERVVALKRLLPEGARDTRHKEMFLREARLAALLAHPNVVHAFAFGELYGELFMAMEYVEGEPLSHVLRACREQAHALEPALTAFVLAQVCDGLHAAHELRSHGAQGAPLHVVHRDVSPHNVLIAYEGHVKLLDFGVAKLETGGSETRTGEVKGKMAYMSPEQALGEKLDRRSDLFSIGAVLFECLTGERMWGSGTDLEVMRKIALESPPRLDRAMPNAPEALVDLHARLMAREPAIRPATAHDISEELRAFASVSMPVTGGQAVQALMDRLFGREAHARRRLLTEALEREAPTRVAELQRTLDPRTAIERRTSTEPLIVRSPEPKRDRRTPETRKPVVAGLLLLAMACVATAAAAWRMGSPAPTPRSIPSLASAPASDTAAVAPRTNAAVPTLVPTSIAIAVPKAAALYSAAASSSPVVPKPRPSTRVSAPARTKSSDPAPSSLPDVDPTPF